MKEEATPEPAEMEAGTTHDIDDTPEMDGSSSTSSTLEKIRKNWALLLIPVVLALAFSQAKAGGNYGSLLKKFNQQSEDHEKQIKALEFVNDVHQKKIKELDEKYAQEIGRIKSDYEEGLQKIATSQKTSRKQIVQAARKDPTSLTKQVKVVFGIPVFSESPGTEEVSQ